MARTNLEAPVYLSRVFLEALIHSKGVLINVASLAGCVPLADAATYSATKFGLRAFSLALRQEVESTGVSVCVVSPGPVATQFILADLDGVSDMTLSQPMLEPEVVAQAIVATAIHRKAEVKLPKMSGLLTTIGYVFPFLQRLLQPFSPRED